jgi:hypothetical protein
LSVYELLSDSTVLYYVDKSKNKWKIEALARKNPASTYYLIQNYKGNVIRKIFEKYCLDPKSIKIHPISKIDIHRPKNASRVRYSYFYNAEAVKEEYNSTHYLKHERFVDPMAMAKNDKFIYITYDVNKGTYIDHFYNLPLKSLDIKLIDIFKITYPDYKLVFMTKTTADIHKYFTDAIPLHDAIVQSIKNLFSEDDFTKYMLQESVKHDMILLLAEKAKNRGINIKWVDDLIALAGDSNLTQLAGDLALLYSTMTASYNQNTVDHLFKLAFNSIDVDLESKIREYNELKESVVFRSKLVYKIISDHRYAFSLVDFADDIIDLLYFKQV